MRRPDPKPSGFTLIEIAVAIVIIGVILAFGVPQMKTVLLQESVRSARRHVTAHLARARATAVQRGCRAVLHLDADAARVWVTACELNGPNGDTVGQVDDLGSRFGATFTADGDSLLFTPQGVAFATTSISMTFSKSGYTIPLEITPVGRPVW